MKKYKICFTDSLGSIEVCFDNFGRLRGVFLDEDCSFSFTKSMEHIPEDLQAFLAKKWKSNTLISEIEYIVYFNEFWETYDKKINKKRSEELWKKLSNTDKIKAMAGLKKYKTYLKRNDWRSQKDADTWLRGRCWEDELK